MIWLALIVVALGGTAFDALNGHASHRHSPSHTIPGRGTGTTTRAMLRAPHGAIYIWPNGALTYPRHLSRYLGRADLNIISKGAFRPHTMRGSLRRIVVDHATLLTIDQYEAVEYHQSRLNSLKGLA